MTDILSYKQLYTELENLNTNICDAIYNEDFEEFNNIINEFIATGIPKQKRFSTARQAYRYAAIPIIINGVWFGYGSKANEILDPHIFHASNGLTIKDIRDRNDKEFYAYMVQNLSNKAKNTSTKQKQITNQNRADNFNLYLDKLSKLYNETEETKSNDLIIDDKAYHKIFTDRIKELVDLRQQLYLAFDFYLVNASQKMLHIKNKTEEEKLEILTSYLPNIYKNMDYDKKMNLLAYKNLPYNIIFSNYLAGKYIDRTNWKRYHNKNYIKLPNNINFYLQLAFYLTLPSSTEIERFLNLHGYSIKTDMLILPKVKVLKEYFVRCKDLCRWIDAGIDYNVLNKLFGYELQIAEVKNPKQKKKEEQEEQKQKEE